MSWGIVSPAVIVGCALLLWVLERRFPTIEFAPMMLLGASPEVPLVKGMVSAVWGFWIHANVDVRTGRLQWVVNGPEAHRWHHATEPDARNLGFATKLALWDRLFGTAFLPRGRKPAGYGLPGGPPPAAPLRVPTSRPRGGLESTHGSMTVS